MSFKNDGVQIEEYVYDFDVDGGAISTISLSAKAGAKSLPLGAMVLDVIVYVETAVAAPGSLTMDVGNTTNGDGYFEDILEASLAIDLGARPGELVAGALLWNTTEDAKRAFPVVVADDADFTIGIVASAATVGKVRFGVMYWLPRTV